MKALVTGSAGFIGSHLYDRLRKGGVSVIGLDKRDSRHTDILMDACDLQSLNGFEYVFHLAGRPGVQASWTEFSSYLHDNLQTTQHLLELAKTASLKKFIFVSSSTVYGKGDGPVSPYGATKLAGEKLCLMYQRELGVPAVIIRPFTVYGPRQRKDLAFYKFISAAIGDGEITLYNKGKQSRCWTYIDDMTAAIIEIAGQAEPGEDYDVGGPLATVKAAVSTIESLACRKIKVKNAPSQPGDPEVVIPRKPGVYIPSIPLAIGLREQYNWQVSHERT